MAEVGQARGPGQLIGCSYSDGDLNHTQSQTSQFEGMNLTIGLNSSPLPWIAHLKQLFFSDFHLLSLTALGFLKVESKPWLKRRDVDRLLWRLRSVPGRLLASSCQQRARSNL